MAEPEEPNEHRGLEGIVKPQDLAHTKQKLIAYLQDNPVRRAVSHVGGAGERVQAADQVQLSPAGRNAYQLMVAKTIIADGDVDPDEIARLYTVFAVLDTGPAERLELVQQLAFEPDELDQEPVPDEILQNDELRFALARDALFVGQLQQGDEATQHEVQKILGEIQLTPGQADVMFDWVSYENGLLRRLGAGDEWMAPENSVKEFTARAAAVGLPLSALYVAGSVVGFSAAGISSGLATIGTYTGLTVLGLNPMTAGIAGLIIAGVTIKKVADFTLSASAANEAAQATKTAEVVALQLRAATRLAQDIPEFAQSPGILRGKTRKHMTDVLQDALIKMLERASAPLEGPQT